MAVPYVMAIEVVALLHEFVPQRLDLQHMRVSLHHVRRRDRAYAPIPSDTLLQALRPSTNLTV